MSIRTRGGWAARLVLGAGAATMSALALAGTVVAQPPPDPCSPAEFMRAHAATIHQMADYVDAHPEVKQAVGDAWKSTTPQERQAAIKSFMDSRPDVADAQRGIQQPLKDLANKCGRPAPDVGLGGPA